MLEARTQASVALFKLGAHSATLRPEFGGPKSLRCCCAKGVGHRAQLMLRARRGARENDYPVPLLRTPTPQKLSLSCPHSEHRGGSQLPSLSTSCHVADRERISSCSARRVAKAKVLPEPPPLVLVLVEMLEGVLCGAVRSQASSEGRRTLTLLGCRARRRLRHDGRVATAVLGRADAHVQPALGLVVTADAGCLSNRFCSVLLCAVHGLECRPQRRCCAGGGRGHAGLDQRLSPQLLRKHGFGGRSWLQFYECCQHNQCLAPAECLRPSTADITWFRHGIRILLFVRVGVYCRFVNGTASATRAPCGQSP